MSMLENLKKAETEHGLGSEAFKVQNDNNIVRVLSEGIYHESEYRDPKSGKANVTKKFVMFVIDRRDGKVKPYFAPYGVYKQIASLEEDPFYKFQGMPMPYDINIKVENAGTMNATYNVQASPNKSELTADEIAAFRAKGLIMDYVKGLKEDNGDQTAKSADEAPLPPEPFK